MATEVDTELQAMIEQARALPPMTPDQREKQRRSFAYGNTHISNANITRKMVDDAAERIDEEN